ncbi:AAA family ATPase [Brevibacillus borstelensis]|uniref:AAA family ATPase n=1 Tax=Brevibacillus borstelensis TaxID=45462 RepID=UPI0030CFD3FF
MKPIRLKLAGLHSYREMQEIDFEKLCEAGLFGIFGPTGSGKSTILDAITLALYGQVVRLGGGSHPKDVLNQLEQRVFVSFTFELGSGAERKRYTIEREFGLNKNGNWRQPEVRLIQCGTDEETPDVVLESKATMATAAVESLIGLTLQDFTRAVVLPQGQFSRFLTLKGSDRNEMLQRMFHLHIYGEKLSERVRAGLEATRERLHKIELEKAALGDAGPEALEQARKTWEEAARQERVYAEQRDGLAGMIKEMEQVYGWQEELERVRERLAEQLARTEEAAEWERLAKRLEASVRLWPQVQQFERLDTEWKETAVQLEDARKKQEVVQQAHLQAEESYVKCASELQREEPLMIERKSRLIQAAEWEEEMSALRAEWTVLEQEWQKVSQELTVLKQQLARDKESLNRLESERAELEKSLEAAQVKPEWRDFIVALRDAKLIWEREEQKRKELATELEGVESERRSAASELEMAQKEWEKSASQLAEARTKLAQLEATPPSSEAEWTEKLDALSQIKQWGRQWREQEQALANWEEKRQTAQREQEQAATRLHACEAKVKMEEEAQARRRSELERLRAEWEQWREANMARMLRDRLNPGEACPVCGSSHHPCLEEPEEKKPESDNQQAAGESIRQQMRETEEAVRHAEQQIRTAFEALQTAKGEWKLWEQRMISLGEERAVLMERIDAIRRECAALGEKWAVGDITKLLQMYKQEEAALKSEAEAREAYRAERERLQKWADGLRDREAEKKRMYERSAVLGEQLLKKEAAAKARLEAAAVQAEEAKRRLEDRLGDVKVEEIEKHWEAIGKRDRETSVLQQARAEKESLYQSLLAGYQEAVSRHAALHSQQALLGERLEEKKRLWEQKHGMWLERTGGQPARKLLTTVEQTLQQLRTSLDEAENKRKETREAREEVQNAVVKLSEGYAVLSRQRTEAAEQMHRSLAESGLGTPERAGELYRERDRLVSLQEQLSAYQTELARLRYDEERLLKALDGRHVTKVEWEAAKQAWDEAEEGHQAAKEQVAVTRQTFAQVEQNHEKWLSIEKRLAEEMDEQSRLEELKKLLEGKAFVQFIAEEKLASIARDASYHLMRMTKNRYALEIGDEGEFILRDEGAGGMRRPISTLSGGETFLTSLSLALALSMEIQMRGGRLEFFFLDEGFGTLDPELLEVVMDALERLRMDDFTIGVISHVPEIRVRMPRRLIITPAEPMGEGSTIRMETE